MMLFDGNVEGYHLGHRDVFAYEETVEITLSNGELSCLATLLGICDGGSSPKVLAAAVEKEIHKRGQQ